MKKITETTVLKSKDNTYNPVTVDNVIYWVDDNATECRYYLHLSIDGRHQIYDLLTTGNLADFKRGQPIGWCVKVVAQSQPKLPCLPVIHFDNRYTESDIIRSFDIARKRIDHPDWDYVYETNKELLDAINSVSIITVDNDFNVLNIQ